MSAFTVDSKAMLDFQLNNRESLTYSHMMYERVSKMGLGLLEREQEYYRLMTSMPDHLRRKDDPLYKPAHTTTATASVVKIPFMGTMRPPTVHFEEETDLDDYYEGSSVQPAERENHVRYTQFSHNQFRPQFTQFMPQFMPHQFRPQSSSSAADIAETIGTYLLFITFITML